MGYRMSFDGCVTLQTRRTQGAAVPQLQSILRHCATCATPL
jgi:hypothetical protein